MVFTVLLFCVRNYDLSQSVCIRHVLGIQHNMKHHLKHLLSLNKEANRLRRQYRHTYSLYKKALRIKNIALVGILRARMAVIQFKRRLLDGRQKRIFTQGGWDLAKGWRGFKRELMPFHPRWLEKDHPLPLPLAVVGRPLRGIAKSYYPAGAFSTKQKIVFSWSMYLHRFLPHFLKEAFFTKKLSAYFCAATIYREEGKWIVGLIR